MGCGHLTPAVRHHGRKICMLQCISLKNAYCRALSGNQRSRWGHQCSETALTRIDFRIPVCNGAPPGMRTSVPCGRKQMVDLQYETRGPA
jgi:hypothetical protein